MSRNLRSRLTRPRIAAAAVLLVAAGLPLTLSASTAYALILSGSTVTGVTPNGQPGQLASVRGGTTVSISGVGFNGPAGVCAPGTTVSFGAVPGGGPLGNDATNVQVVSDNLITAVSPPFNPATVDVIVNSPACGHSFPTVADRFTYSFVNEKQSTFNAGTQDSGADLCASGSATYCTVTVDATASLGPVSHAGAGLLHGYSDGGGACGSPSTFTPAASLQAQLQSLHLKHWRVSDNDWGDGPLPRSLDVPTIEVLSDDWVCQHGATVPWDDPLQFQDFASSTVSALEAQGIHPEYWEIINEPGTCPFCDPSRSPDVVRQDFSNLFAAGLRGIKQADPQAHVIGPSLTAFATDPSQYSTSDQYDLSTFLNLTDLLATTDPTLRFSGIAWHELENCWRSCANSDLSAYPFSLFSPADLTAHIAAARTLMGQHPTTGSLPVLVTESMPSDQFFLPGMAAGYLASSEAANVTEMNRTCFGCGSGFDGLFVADPANPTNNSPAPTAIYFVYDAYAGMSGERVSSDSTAADLDSLATWDANTRILKVLIGRAGECGPSQQGAADRCPSVGSSWDVPAQANVSIRLPSATTTAVTTEQEFSMETGSSASSGPITVYSQSMTPTGQNLTVPLYSLRNGQPAGVVDGDAFLLTIQL